jgi:acyl-CoA-dependent ceramide synthase
MDSEQVPGWLPSFLVPFISLSYQAATPVDPDSFPKSAYYTTGPLDFYLIIGFIALMAVLRDVTRLGLMEPFAKWKLARDLDYSRTLQVDGKAPALAANGNGHAVHANGHTRLSQKVARKLHRKVLRFAEQGWSVIYYSLTWCYGLVRLSSFH